MPESIDWLPLISFVLITLFTPGPNGLSAMSLSMLYGFKQAAKFCMGVGAGYIVIMLADAFISNALLTALPVFESILRVAGALYIAWLALGMLRRSFQIEMRGQARQGFWYAFFFQLINVKGILFGLTLFSTFLSPLRGNLPALGLAAVAMALLAWIATSCYAFFGAAIRRSFDNPTVRKAVSIVLSLALFYVALRIAGFFEWLRAVMS